MIQKYLESHSFKHHGHRHTRECQHVVYGNVTKSKVKAHGIGSPEIILPIAETRHAVLLVGNSFDTKVDQVHLTKVNNPLSTVSVLEPGSIGGCHVHNRSTVIETAKQKNCMVAINAGFFNTSDGSCKGIIHNTFITFMVTIRYQFKLFLLNQPTKTYS